MPIYNPDVGIGSTVSIGEIEPATLVTEAEGIPANDNDTTIPTSAAVKDYVDDTVAGLPGSPVDSVNGETGVVVLDPDHLDDTSTTNKFTTAGEISKLAGIESGADVTDATNVEAAGAVMEADYNANTILAATSDNTPAALAVAEQTVVGRKTGGNIASLTVGELLTILGATENGVDNFLRLGAGEAVISLVEIDGNYGSSSPSFSNVGTTTINNFVAPFTGTYTPTLTDVTNIASHGTVSDLNYMRVGSMVFVSGRVNVDPTAAGAATELGISLPIATNFGLFTQCAGVAFTDGVASLGGRIMADTTNDRAALKFVSLASEHVSRDFSVFFMYQII